MSTLQSNLKRTPAWGYEYASNSIVANNSVIMAYAYDISKDMTYLNGVTKAMDYIFGRNGLGISYVTGYNGYYVNNPVHRYWKHEYDKDYPSAPFGVMVSGPYSRLYDDYVYGLGMEKGKIAPQKCYADSVEAWSVNDTAPDWQAALVWNLSFIEDEAGSYGHEEKITYGDANCDGSVDMADIVLVMQSLANPNKYGIGGTDANALTNKGAVNADVDQSVKGLTSNDALYIQKYLLHIIDSLAPEK